MVNMILQEGAHSSAEQGIEGLVTQIVMGLKLGVEAFGALIIGIGVLLAVFHVMRALVAPEVAAYYRIRLRLSRFLALALEFQLAADILGSAISPTWDQVGKLGAIAALRTALNYFLEREIREEEELSEKKPAGQHTAAERLRLNALVSRTAVHRVP